MSKRFYLRVVQSRKIPTRSDTFLRQYKANPPVHLGGGAQDHISPPDIALHMPKDARTVPLVYLEINCNISSELRSQCVQ